MIIESFNIEGLKLLIPSVHSDSRGWFMESYNEDVYSFAGIPTTFKQDNLSFSKKGVLRGMHYQLNNPQGKLVSVLKGAVWDVVVDIRKDSPTFGEWEAVFLSEENKKQFWIPVGFAHGFYAKEDTLFHYKCSSLRDAESEGSLKWSDPVLNGAWGFVESLPTISDKDNKAISFKELCDKL